MSTRSSVSAVPHPSGLRLPSWVDRIVSAGIVSDNPEIRRRQKFVNAAAYVGIANAAQHGVYNAFYDFTGLWPTNVYNLSIIACFLLVPVLHRFGENIAAAWLITAICVGHLGIIWLVGTESNLQIYFTLGGVIVFFFGFRNWRWWLSFLALAAVALLAALLLLPHHGIVATADHAFRQSLSTQAYMNALAINTVLIAYALWALREAERALQAEHDRAETLLDTLLPNAIARRLKADPQARIADRLDCVAVLFVDLVGFTPASRSTAPEEVVAYLDRLVCRFDELAEKHGVDKIKTIGDAYMAIGIARPDDPSPAVAVGRLALDMLKEIGDHPPLGGSNLTLRAGIHCGPAIAGVIGDKRFTYDVWGDAVNIAARMESHGLPGEIQVSETFASTTGHALAFEPRGSIDVKGAGEMPAYLLRGAK
ncbi:MAG: hypothetical protein C0606_10645 [Hyphomicrobiales bacterium]|nr:MAG: hypothetical protein C0606_10645 [Hyphomicrobiales bacterium]